MPDKTLRETPTILISILVFSETDKIIKILEYLPHWVDDFALTNNFSVKIVIRLNNPQIEATALRTRIAELSREFKEKSSGTDVILTGVGYNTGFGGGHNRNFVDFESDYVVVLNDDIGIPHIKWLSKAVAKFTRNPKLGIVGEISNPRGLSPYFGNGEFPSPHKTVPVQYAEASILVMRGSAFKAAGMFDEGFEWAMFEDADLSLRMQQLGYRIEWIDMPHEHWRSSSFNTLPSFVKSSFKEHNRARFFAKWGYTLSSGKPGYWNIFDLFSDGIGDIFCALFHVDAELCRLTPQLRAAIVVNTNHPELAKLFLPETVNIESEKDVDVLLQKFGNSGGVASFRSIREVIYAHPFNIHTLITAGLSVARADDKSVAEAFNRFRRRSRPPENGLAPEPYAVVHLESLRESHDGRVPAEIACQTILDAASKRFGTVVLVGLRKNELSLPSLPDRKIVDLGSTQSLAELIHVVSGASGFIGLDSLPAHIAQLSGVPAVIIFGSVNPLTRIWSEHLAWPIVADLDCIGCYHDLIESSVPFCMRRDNACMSHISEAMVETAIDSMIKRVPYDWERVRRSLDSRQHKFLRTLQYHPAPPQHFVRPKMPNENVSNIIYDIVGKITSIYGQQLRNSVVDQVRFENTLLHREIEAKDAMIDELGEPTGQGQVRAASTLSDRRIDLESLMQQIRDGVLKTMTDWCDFHATTSDPQIFLAPMMVRRKKIEISIAAAATIDTRFKLYWRYDNDEFSEANAVTLSEIGREARILRWEHTVDEVRWLHLRVDPADAVCLIRFKGYLIGDVLVFREFPDPSSADGPAATVNTVALPPM